MKKQYKKIFFNWCLALVILTLPFPKYSLNSQSIILLFISWLLCSSLKEKLFILKKFILPFLVISSVFWLNVISLLVSSNAAEVLKVLVRNLPFLLIPLIIFTSIKDRDALIGLLKVFAIAVIAALAFGYCKSLYLKAFNLGDFFYYTDFAKVLGVHTTYFALFILLSIIYLVTDLVKLKTIPLWLIIGLVAFLITGLYTISARISLVALVAVAVITLIGYANVASFKYKIIGLTSIVVITVLFYFSPNFENRNAGISSTRSERTELQTRLLHWKVVKNHIFSGNLWMGSGYGNEYDILFQEYLEAGFTEGFKKKYNAHNQFLEIALRHGLLGAISLTIIYVILFLLAIKTRDVTVFLIASVFFIFMFTESVLERHHGIVTFSLFLSFSFLRLHYQIVAKKKRMVQ